MKKSVEKICATIVGISLFSIGYSSVIWSRYPDVSTYTKELMDNNLFTVVKTAKFNLYSFFLDSFSKKANKKRV